MNILTKIVHMGLYSRVNSITEFCKTPFEAQNRQLQILLAHFEKTEYAKHFSVSKNDSYDKFAQKLPVVKYDDISPWVDKVREGKNNILWDEPIKWFAKSSGTTGKSSKFLPVSENSLHNCHYRGMKDVITLSIESHPGIDIFGGKAMTLGGSHALDLLSGCGAHSGDLSAILIENTPKLASFVRVPSQKVALEPDFGRKVELICKECAAMNVTSIAGVPSWNLVMLKALLDYTGKSCVADVWPNIELFMHGGISFAPYREIYDKVIGSSRMKYIESYNASEGFFAIQDDHSRDDMLLMLDYEVFYEFLPLSSLEDTSKCVPLEGVRQGVNYAMIISTSGGMWRYMIGDTVTFTSTNPHRIKITGRTTQYINTFGEEIIVDNSDKAIMEASKLTGAVVKEYSAAPIYMSCDTKGAHEWIIEFERKPESLELFCEHLDKTLAKLNSDYEAKRKNDSTLYAPKIIVAESGTFYNWMKHRGKQGGQNKVPRLANNREYIDSIINFMNTCI